MLTNIPYQIILASGSPRRKELLEMCNIPFVTRVSPAEEVVPPGMDVYMVPEHLAKVKLEPVLQNANENELIIAADTVVILQNTIFGKPKNRTEALEMLKTFSGQSHTVVSGVAFAIKQKPVYTFSVSTEVTFYPMEEQFLSNYIDKYQPFDKAGAYAIQEVIGLVGVKKVNGCFFNVIGLPVSRLLQEIQIYCKQ